MLGVLVKGDLDDGRGKARVNLFRHKHEVETGRTSSVGMEIMGFDAVGNVVASENPGRKYMPPSFGYLLSSTSRNPSNSTNFTRQTQLGGDR